MSAFSMKFHNDWELLFVFWFVGFEAGSLIWLAYCCRTSARFFALIFPSNFFISFMSSFFLPGSSRSALFLSYLPGSRFSLNFLIGAPTIGLSSSGFYLGSNFCSFIFSSSLGVFSRLWGFRAKMSLSISSRHSIWLSLCCMSCGCRTGAPKP